METDDAVEKQRTVFPQHLAKRCCVSHSFHRPGGDQSTNEQNNKTGHFTCYQNRTFSFATDILDADILDAVKSGTTIID
jgi:hypothetical protein